MTPKEKAIELFNRMKTCTECKCYSWDDDNARKSALICVDEIMNNGLLEPQLKRHYLNGDSPTPQMLEYWQKVKTEITNL